MVEGGKWANDFGHEPPQVDWLVKDMFERGSINVLYGEPGCGKSFLSADLGLKIACGMPWWGFKTKLGPVVYISTESSYPRIHRRFVRWFQYHEVDPDIPLYWKHGLSFGDEWASHLYEIEHLDPTPRFIIIDTLAGAARGFDENSPEGMGRMLECLSEAQRSSQATILATHHTGKRTIGLRGHSSLLGAVDGTIQVHKKEEALEGWWRDAKERDTHDKTKRFFRIEGGSVGRDEDGDPILAGLALEIDSMDVGRTEPKTILLLKAFDEWFPRGVARKSAIRDMAIETNLTDPSHASRDLPKWLQELCDDGSLILDDLGRYSRP